MPVIGHAFVGLATAMVATPRQGIRRRGFLWVPAIVALSYLPDIVGQPLSMLNARSWHNIAHSLILSVPIAAAFTPVLAGVFGLGRLRSFCVALASVALHGVLDALYSGKPMLFWPMTPQSEGPAIGQHPPILLEMLVFPAAFGLFWLAWRWRQRASGRPLTPAVWLGTTRKERWVSIGLTLAILGAAGGTCGLWLLRNHQGRMIDVMCRQKRYEEALRYLELSSRWPSSRPPSRFHGSRGSIYWAMGKRDRAESEFHKAYEADASDFWAVFRLAEFYASGPAPLEVRRRRAAPYLEQLAAKFSADADFVDRVPRVRRKLGYADSPATASAPG